jgi:hypothetical protein
MFRTKLLPLDFKQLVPLERWEIFTNYTASYPKIQQSMSWLLIANAGSVVMDQG